MIELHFWTTANGYKPLIFLEESGLPYRIRPVDIGSGEQFRPQFLAISPNNRIPAIVDDDPSDGGGPVSLFESGAILLYLAEKCCRFLPATERGRKAVLEWLMWQVSGLGPMLGQNHHFVQYAPVKLDYAIERYTKEAQRLYGVLERQLEDRDFVCDEYSVADMACYPWCRLWERHGVDISGHPRVDAWLARMAARPAVQRAYEIGRSINTVPVVNDASRSILFGQRRRKAPR